ncbi:MAG: hypothetical protein JWL63_1328 [Rhodocyclales bacterium]|nr:hypothetical protein [Rhodocyclales bacterium]
MMLRCCVLTMILVSSGAFAKAANADSPAGLGRLFVTPQKRALLDELRHGNVRIEPTQQLENVRLDGIVRRSSGKQTIWINGQSYNDRAPVTRMDESSARIISGSKAGVELKVGESARLTPESAAPKEP